MVRYIMEIELLELKKRIFEDIEIKLSHEILFKIKKRTKAYFEISNFVNELNIEIKNFEIQINELLSKLNNYSSLKIKTSVLKDLLVLRNELENNSISELLELFVDNYRDLILLDSLTEIVSITLNKKTENILKQTAFYVCKEKEQIESDKTIVYKIDDLIIHNNIEYLNLENFINYNFDNHNFLFSSKYTLDEFNKFRSIW
jgi:hypothetical protein